MLISASASAAGHDPDMEISAIRQQIADLDERTSALRRYL